MKALPFVPGVWTGISNEIPIRIITHGEADKMYGNKAITMIVDEVDTLTKTISLENGSKMTTSKTPNPVRGSDYQNLISAVEQGPDRWNRSSVERLSRSILGPSARTWKVTGGFALGHDRNGVKMELGRGTDYKSAFRAVFVDTVRMKEHYRALERGEDVDTSK